MYFYFTGDGYKETVFLPPTYLGADGEVVNVVLNIPENNFYNKLTEMHDRTIVLKMRIKLGKEMCNQ